MSIFSDINRDIQGNAYRWITPFKEVTGMVPKSSVLARDGRHIPQTDKAAAYELMDQAMEYLRRRDQCIRLIKKIQADPIAMASPEGNERQTTYRMAWLKSYQCFAFMLRFAAELYERHGLSTSEATPEMKRKGILPFRDISWTDYRSDRSTEGRAGYVLSRGGKVYVFEEPRDWMVFADEQLAKLRDQFGFNANSADGRTANLKGTMGEPLTAGAIVLYCVIAVALAVVVVAITHHLDLAAMQEISKQDMQQVADILASAEQDERKYEQTGDPAYLVSAQQKRELARQLDENRTKREIAAGKTLDPFAGLADALKNAQGVLTVVAVMAALYFAAPYLLAFTKRKGGAE